MNRKGGALVWAAIIGLLLIAALSAVWLARGGQLLSVAGSCTLEKVDINGVTFQTLDDLRAFTGLEEPDFSQYAATFSLRETADGVQGCNKQPEAFS